MKQFLVLVSILFLFVACVPKEAQTPKEISLGVSLARLDVNTVAENVEKAVWGNS